LYIKYM